MSSQSKLLALSKGIKNKKNNTKQNNKNTTQKL